MKAKVNERSLRELIPPERVRLRESHIIEVEGISSSAQERTLGSNDLVDINYFVRGITASRSVCRIILRDEGFREKGYGTGFKVSPNLLLTNRHVLEAADHAKNTIVEFDFELDPEGNPKPITRFQLRPDLLFTANADLDYALVAIEPTPIFGRTALADFGFLRLNPGVGKINMGEFATIIQHPGGQTKQVAARENKVIKEVEEYDLTLMYYSDTAQGSSGSPVFNDSWQVVALHFTGVPKTDESGNWLLKNGSIATRFDDDSDVNWIANSGMRVSVIVNDLKNNSSLHGNSLFKEFLKTCDGMVDLPSMPFETDDSPRTSTPIHNPSNGKTGNDSTQSSNISTSEHQRVFNVPVTVSVRIGEPSGIGQHHDDDGSDHIDSANPALSTAPEAKVEPFHERDYSTRAGYDEEFLGTTVPMPSVYNKRNLSKLENNDIHIPYHKFTIVNNKKRRLALFTASNIDGRKEAKKPEPNKTYNRAALAGLRKNDREKWFLDPRIPSEDQLSDEFYNKDRKAFDKGHLVRREDVAWGSTYADVRKANGDTYHITNCSPQVKEFNRSMEAGVWGQLENNILRQAKSERYCVFSGPVLLDTDPPFKGVNFKNNLQVQIPRAYWKVIVAINENDELQSFAFLLSQDLDRVAFEFQVSAEWQTRMISIEHLEEITKNIKFPKEVFNADQFDNHPDGAIVTQEVQPTETM